MGFAEGFASGVKSGITLNKAKRDKEKFDWERQDRERLEGARTTLEGKLQSAETVRDASQTSSSATDVSLTNGKPIKLNANGTTSEDEERKNYADGGKVSAGKGKSVSPPTHFPGMRFHP